MLPWIYDTNKDNSVRFTLGIESDNPLFCFGINPSTAEPDRLDNTLKSVERIARRHNFRGWVMLNVYPQRATNPRDIHTQKDSVLHKQNLKHIEKFFKKNKPVILAAWGSLIYTRPFLKECLRDIYRISQKYNCQWKCIGPISKQGHPHHPLYLSNRERMKSFNMQMYIENNLL